MRMKFAQNLVNILKHPIDRFAPIARSLLRMPFHSNFSYQNKSYERGSSLISVIIAMGLVGLLTVGITQITVQGYRANKAVDIRQKLESVRQTVRTRLNCEKTLNITASTVLPISCTNLAQTLLRADGQSVGSGDGWTIKGRCVADELIITATMPGVVDPLTGRNMDSLPSNSSGMTVSQDLFGGTSDFCREYYEQPTQRYCSGTYDRASGNYQGSQLCCRAVESAWTRLAAVARCDANEWILNGTGMCAIDPEWWANRAFLHTNTIDAAGNAWVADCYSDATDTIMPDHPAHATAICCPSFY